MYSLILKNEDDLAQKIITSNSETSGYHLLKEGDYLFEVVDLQLGRTSGAGKLPPCDRIILILRADDGDGAVDVKCNLVLHESLNWKLCQFFKSIGKRKHGEPLVMDWENVIGCTGYGRFNPRSFIGDDGEEHTVNSCERFLEPPADSDMPARKYA